MEFQQDVTSKDNDSGPNPDTTMAGTPSMHISQHNSSNNAAGMDLYLADPAVLRDRGDAAVKELWRIQPYGLSTNATASQFDNMSTGDIHKSFSDLWEVMYRERTLNIHEQNMPIAFKNWLFADLCRRCQVLENRFQRDADPHPQAQNGHSPFAVWLHIPCRGRKLFSKSRFLSSPILQPHVRKRVLDLVNDFGEGLCVCVEFIDMCRVASARDEQHQRLVDALAKHRSTIAHALHDAGVQPLFEQSATKVMAPFKMATRLS